MADINNDGFNSLDPLGPEYGRINQPLLDSKGLSAFEGDRLKMPEINFPSSGDYFPILPNTGGLTSPQKSVRQQVVGKPSGKPGINRKTFDFKAFSKALADQGTALLGSNPDKNTYAKIYSYNAGPDGNAFYERYAAYGDETFSKIGFSPLRDNEAIFNANTTWWDDHKRMMTHSFWPLFSRGFVSGPKSLMKIATGDFFGSDAEDARAYTEAAAIGQSSKKGFGSFVNNTVMNFGYSAGIMSEAILEEIAGVLLAPVTFGGSFFYSTANLAKNSFRAIRGIDKSIDGYKAVNATLKSVDNIAGARKFWQQANKIGTSAFSPVGNTVKAFQAARASDNLTNLGTAFKTFGGFYRDVQRINMSLSEARLEGGIAKNEVYDKLYNEYYAKNGKAPNDEDQYKMVQQSEKASLNTVLWNTALIYGSNAITFPNIMGPKGGIRNFVKNSAQEFKTIKGGKFGDYGKIVYNKAAKSFEVKLNNFKNLAKDWLRQPVYKSTIGTIGYFKANFAEGIQENLQEVIAGANERYYVDTFNSPALGAHEYAKGVAKYNEASQVDYFGEELGKQFTATGFETFASGFAMGVLAAPVNATFQQLGIGYNKMFDKENYENLKKVKKETTEKIVANLNNIDIKEFLDAKTFNYATQDGVASIKQTGSKKQANDADIESLLSQVNTALENGTLDLLKEKIKDLGNLSPEEFEDAIPNTAGEGIKYQEKIPNLIGKIDKIKQRHDYYNERFPNPITDSNIPDKDSAEYTDAIALHYAWKEAIKNAVFFNESFDDTMQRKAAIMEKYLSQAPLKNMSQRDSEVIFDYDKLRNEQAYLKEEIKSLEGLTDEESKKQLAFKKRKFEALENLGAKTNKFNAFFNRYERAEEIRQALKKERGADEVVTDEEVEEVLNNLVGEFTEDNKINIYSEHESAYKEYLKALAGLNNDYLFDQNIDDSYALLADHFKLDSESRRLMDYVNLLHDPNEFMESADRNRQWMKDLYAKRGAIYEKIVKEQLDLVIDNSLLNALANKGVYISLDDFQNWKENGIPPTEFFDNARKIIIPEGTEEYSNYYALFEQAATLKDQKTTTVPEALDKQLKTDLDKADSDMTIELQNLPKSERKIEIRKMMPDKSGIITLTEIKNNLNPEEYADATYGSDELFVLFKDADGNLKIDNEEGEIITKPSESTINFESVSVFNLSEQGDPELVKAITEKYEALKNKIREDYADVKERITEEEAIPIADFVPITNDLESLRDYPVLYNDLYKSFQETTLSKMSEEDFSTLTEDQEDNLFARFLKTDKDAKTKIDEFNKNKKLEESTQETGEKGEFEYIYQGKNKNTSDASTVMELRRTQRRFKDLVKNIDALEDPTAEDLTNKSKYKILITDFEKLIATRSRKGFTPELNAALDKANAIKDKQKGIVSTPEGYTIDEEEYKTLEDALGVKAIDSPSKEYIDSQINSLFSGEGTPEFDSTKITQEAYDNLFGSKGYLTALKQRVDNGEISIMSQDLVVYDSETKIASTIQLLVADTKGNLTVVDVVSDAKSNWDVFKKKDNPKSKLKQTKVLMATKANLLNKMIGVEAKVSVLPIEMSVDNTDKIVIAGKPTSPSLLATDFLINLNTEDIQEQANEIVPVTEKVSTSATEQTSENEAKKNKEQAKQKALEDKVEELKLKEKNEIRSEDGSVSKENSAAFKQNKKDIEEAENNARRGNTVKGKHAEILISTRVPGDDPKVLTGEEEVAAEEKIEAVIQQVFNGKMTAEEAVKFLVVEYAWIMNDINTISLYIRDRTTNAPEVGNNKQSFAAWRRGEFDTQQTSEVEVVNSIKEVRALTDKTNGLSEDTNDYLYIEETFNEKGNKAIQVKKGRFSYLMSVNTDGVIKPLNITDLRSGKTLEYAKAFDGAGNLIESSPNFPISEAQKGIKEVQNLTQKTLSQPASEVAKTADIEKRREEDLKIAKRNFEFLNKEFIPKLEENTNALIEQYDFQKSELLKNTGDLNYVESKYGKTFEDWIPLQIKWLKENKSHLLVDSRNSESRAYKTLRLLQEKNDTENKINVKYDAELDALETSVVPANAESSDDVQSPAVEVGEQERKEVVIDDSLRYRVNDFKIDLAKVNTKEELRVLLDDLNIKNSEEKVAFEDLQEMANLTKEKNDQLNTPSEIKIAAESLNIDSQFVAKNIIFTETGNSKSKVFAQADDTVIVSSINKANKTITVTALGSDLKLTVGFNQLNNLFALKDLVMDTTQSAEQAISKEDQTKIIESTDLADTFVKNSNNELDKVEGIASNKSLTDLDEELLNDIDC